MQLIGLHYSPALVLVVLVPFFFRVSYKESSVLRNRIGGSLKISVSNGWFSIRMPFARDDLFQDGHWLACVANGKMHLLSFCFCRRASFPWVKVVKTSDSVFCCCLFVCFPPGLVLALVLIVVWLWGFRFCKLDYKTCLQS